MAPTGCPLETRPPERVDRDLPIEHGRPGFRKPSSFPDGTESEHLDLVDLGKGSGVVDLGHIDVLRADSRHGIGLLGAHPGRAQLVGIPVFASGHHTGPDLDGPVLNRRGKAFEILTGTEDSRRGPIADGRAHGTGQGVADQAVLKDFVQWNIKLVLGLGVERTEVVVLGCGHGDLSLGRPMLLHVVTGLNGIGVHEDRSVWPGLKLLAAFLCDGPVNGNGLFPVKGIDSLIEDLEDRHRIQFRIEDLLHADRQGDLTLAAQDILPCPMECHGGRCTGPFHIDYGDPFGKEFLPDQGDEADLPPDVRLTPVPHAAVSEPGELDFVAVFHSGVFKGTRISVPCQLFEALVRPFLELGGIRSDDVDLSHFLSPLFNIQDSSI